MQHSEESGLEIYKQWQDYDRLLKNKITSEKEDKKLVHLVILGRYFGMISQNFGMKIYYYLLFHWQTEKIPVLDD